MKILNPANGQLLDELDGDNKVTLEKKFHSLKEGQKKWKKVALKDRLSVIEKYKNLLLENIEDLAVTMTSEVGKPLQESRGEIKGACGRIDFFLEQAENWLSKNEVKHDGTTQEILSFEPLGVVANISAWNYPYLVGVNVQIPALLAGNSLLYKPSEFASLSGKKMVDLFHRAGIPQDVIQLGLGAREVGEVICDLPFQGYFFTGSVPTGLAIHKKVAPKLVPIGLELGGKDPLYVTDEIKNMANAAASVCEGVFYNNGQSCCSVERVYVHEKVYDDFLKEFLSCVKNLKVGDPMDTSTTQGPLTRAQHVQFLIDQVQDALDQGATLACGGDGKDGYFNPTVLTEVNHSMRVMKEETFGPVIGVQKVSGDEEALKLMDDTEYGLTASVFCDNQERAESILSELEVGNAFMNCSDRVSPHLPWAGQRNSGLGATLGYLGILAFVRPKGYHFRKN